VPGETTLIVSWEMGTVRLTSCRARSLTQRLHPFCRYRSACSGGGGDSVNITVNAADFSGVSSISANGTTLTQTGQGTWSGDVVAASGMGAMAFSLPQRIPGAGCDRLVGKLHRHDGDGDYRRLTCLVDYDSASTKWLFKAWGMVTIIDASSFSLADGSGTTVTVIAPGIRG